MKLHVDVNAALNTVTAYGAGYVEINRQRHAGAVLVRPEGEILPWAPASFEALTAADFEALLAQRPELIVLGTGDRQRFPHPRLVAALTSERIGVEAMDTRAACRTYNILMSEGRKVLAALLPLA
ncbi:MAG TPA: Mth938-like domain-containing protein [Quisquiliibacterium sp.]|nr:Mth938-like domain-containing protein [Quisquiliibacterium sp.]HQN14685.1 Mth938-like domain-containing protein [Quisquiliibacterium sp.]